MTSSFIREVPVPTEADFVEAQRLVDGGWYQTSLEAYKRFGAGPALAAYKTRHNIKVAVAIVGVPQETSMPNAKTQAVVRPNLPLRELHLDVATAQRALSDIQVEDLQGWSEDVWRLKLRNAVGERSDERYDLIRSVLVERDLLGGEEIALRFDRADQGRHFVTTETDFRDVDVAYLAWVCEDLDLPYIEVEVAYTMDQCTPDGFGGAGFLITRDAVHRVDTNLWLELKKAELGLRPDGESP